MGGKGVALRKIGGFLTGLGKRLETKALVGMYGKQVGKTAKNGNRVFKRVEKDVTFFTRVDGNGHVVATVSRQNTGGTYFNHFHNSDGTRARTVTRPTHYTEKVIYNNDGTVAKRVSIELENGKPLTRRELTYPEAGHPFREMPTRYVQTQVKQDGNEFFLERFDSAADKVTKFIG